MKVKSPRSFRFISLWFGAFCLLLLAIACINQANAQTFFVATNGVDQTSGGNAQNPWATISFAIDQVPDGATIEVLPGIYNGRVRLDQAFTNGVVVRSSQPYQARLRHDSGAVVICFTCQGISVEGFDIAHATNNTTALVIQIQNTEVTDVTLRNNIIHDSTNNDLLRVNNGARNILIEGNIFYNQAGSDEHVDVNSTIGVTVQDNVFFNTGSQSNTSSYIVIKDSNGNSDGLLGVRDTTVRRNIFLNWHGSAGQSFIRVGEDNTTNFEADGVLIENNLMIGNSNQLMRSSLTIQGSRDILVRNNTVVGDLPSRNFAVRFLRDSNNQANQNIVLSNNIWSDPTGSLGTEGFVGADVFEALANSTQAITLNNNLYYNGGSQIPSDTAQQVNVGQDNSALIGDPLLPEQSNIVLPVFNGSGFASGEENIRQVFLNLAERFARPQANSMALNQADPSNAAADDLLGVRRTGNPDVGAYEIDAGTDPTLPTPPSERPILSWLMLLLDD